MSEMSMKVLEVVTANANKTADEIINAVYRAFPNDPYDLLEGYIYQLGKEKYLAVQPGDNRIFAIHVNSTAYVALREWKSAPAEKSTTQINVGSIGNVSGQLAIGNKGGSYDMRVSKIVVNEMSDGLKNVIAMSDRRMTNELEREQFKRLVEKILESLNKSESPSQGLIEQLDSFLQRHSWISAPLATAFLNALGKLFSH